MKQVIWADVLHNLLREEARKRATKVFRLPRQHMQVYSVSLFLLAFLVDMVERGVITGAGLCESIPLLSVKYEPFSRGSHQVRAVRCPVLNTHVAIVCAKKGDFFGL